MDRAVSVAPDWECHDKPSCSIRNAICANPKTCEQLAKVTQINRRAAPVLLSPPPGKTLTNSSQPSSWPASWNKMTGMFINNAHNTQTWLPTLTAKNAANAPTAETDTETKAKAEETRPKPTEFHKNYTSSQHNLADMCEFAALSASQDLFQFNNKSNKQQTLFRSRSPQFFPQSINIKWDTERYLTVTWFLSRFTFAFYFMFIIFIFICIFLLCKLQQQQQQQKHIQIQGSSRRQMALP